MRTRFHDAMVKKIRQTSILANIKGNISVNFVDLKNISMSIC